MSVNIWVTAKNGERIPISWGPGIVPTTHSKVGYVINFIGSEDSLPVRETLAEIMALVAAEQRKRDRLMLAGRFLSGAAVHMSERPDDYPDSTPKDYAKWSVEAADALLAALDATEGAE